MIYGSVKYLNDSDRHLRIKYYVFFRAFFINFALVLIVWALSWWPGFMKFVAEMLHVDLSYLYESYINWLIAWDIGGIVLFLVPALAAYWARFALRRIR